MWTGAYEGGGIVFVLSDRQPCGCGSWFVAHSNKLMYFYLFNYWFSAAVICGISPPTVAAIPSLDRLIFCVANFAAGHLRRRWNSQAAAFWVVVVPNDQYYLGGCCA